MSGNRSLLCELILKHAGQEGLNATSIPGVRCLKFTKATPSVKGEWARSFVIVAQGQKEIELVENVYRYGQAHYIAAPLDLPVVSRVRKASPTEPYLALLLSFDPIELSEVSSQMPLTPETDSNLDSYGLFSGKVSDDMLEAAVRLAKLLSKPEDAKVLAPLVIREIYYHLLRSSNGTAIRQFSKSGTRMHKIAKSIRNLKQNLSDSIDVATLAERVNMSRTDFFRAFKEITAMSPIQYQKRLRLAEARRLIFEESETAESASYKVGYMSTSQFSREYTRVYGQAPIRDRHSR